MKYLIIMTAPSRHLMHEPDDFIRPYLVEASDEREFNEKVEYAETLFVKEYNVPRASVQLLLKYKVK